MTGSDKKITFAQKLKGHFILARPQQLLWLDIFASLGFFAVLAQKAPNLHYIWFVLCAIIADAGACTINDVGDYDSDKLSTEKSRSKRPLVTGVVSRKAAVNQALILYAIGLVIAFYLDLYVFILAFLLVLISWQYSMPPLKLDGRPIFSNLFWIGFGFLYYFALVAYLVRYEGLTTQNIYNGLYFLLTLFMFMGIAETLAKDLRDMENDRESGIKNTTPAVYGHKSSALVAAVFSAFVLTFWAIPYFTVFETQLILRILILALVVTWTIVCTKLCMAIYREYTKSNARKLHLGFILTFTILLTISFIAGVT
jgi:geranylgeranylglycerol-phosphate geranylgeranyltransferase